MLRRLRLYSFLAVIFLLTVVNPGMTDSAKTSQLHLVASTTQIADLVRHITGDRCRVSCILAPGADPHTYMPTPNDVRLVTSADLTFENGLNLEGKNWMATLAADAGKPLITVTDGIEPLTLSHGGETLSDPHAWFSPKNAAVYANNISRAVSQLDREGKFGYSARTRLLLNQLRILDAWIKTQVARIPATRRVLVTSHDAFNYFCREYGFNAEHGYLSLAPVGWSTGSEVGAGMTPERRKEVIQSIKNFNAPAVFVETSVNPKLIREIARESGVAIGGNLYSDSMGEAGSAGETYIGMMRENVITILEALIP